MLETSWWNRSMSRTPACFWPPEEARHITAVTLRGCGQYTAIAGRRFRSRPGQKPEHRALERIFGLDHRPMATVRKHVEFGALGMVRIGISAMSKGLTSSSRPQASNKARPLCA